MKLALKSIIATASFIAMGAASAAPANVSVGGSIDGFTLVGGTGTLTFDRSLVTAINTGQIKLAEAAPASGYASPAADRLSQLEEEVERLKSQLQALEARLAHLEG